MGGRLEIGFALDWYIIYHKKPAVPSEKTETYRYIERIGGFHEMELNYIDIGCNLIQIS